MASEIGRGRAEDARSAWRKGRRSARRAAPRLHKARCAFRAVQGDPTGCTAGLACRGAVAGGRVQAEG
ncbi:Hypothetical protein CAP_3802 [Chondromyces apiculatus DSM 436]|uniref:Uncharacterized protein n=1 Tax=Chondromyces apiculatus DSM 436 TaxID=1192034 RepID=A0A017T8R4_9BACT|nr:Hypothetical protein CAP_3802 [Chondromyces apiculatus DSM 436]